MTMSLFDPPNDPKTRQSLDSTTGCGQESAENRRSSPRLNLSLDIHLTSDSNFYLGISDNISEGGVFVATQHLRPIGSEIELTFSLPDEGPPIRVTGRVQWLRERMREWDERGNRAAVAQGLAHRLIDPTGMGLKFIDMPESARQRIEDFIRDRQPSFYDD